MKNQQQIIFNIGAKVRVKTDYQNNCESDYRSTIGTVIGHYTDLNSDTMHGETLAEGHFIDNIVQFENDICEPFANWELTEEMGD